MKNDAIFTQVLILFLIMSVGFIARKKNLLNNKLNSDLIQILLNITLPASIIVSFHLRFSPELLHNVLKIFYASVFVHLFSLIVGGILFFKYPDQDRKILWFIAIFSNTGFMGLPVLESVFGQMGVFYGSIYVAIFNIFVWTLGVAIFAGRRGLKIRNALTTPALIAVIIGFSLFLFSLEIPAPLFKACNLIGSMTTPLSMIVIGSILAELKLGELLANFEVYYGTIVRLLIIPLTAAFLLQLFGLQHHLLKICITSTAMPAASMTAIFAEKYNGNTLLASRLIFISTALSILTIPLILVLI